MLDNVGLEVQHHSQVNRNEIQTIMRDSATTDVAVIGAGPYGLSIAAHLRQHGVPFRIFGVPLQSWRTAMPQGMFLKSEGAASSLSDPAHAMTLARYCVSQGLPYKDHAMPVSLSVFVGYGLAFQKQLVPEVEERGVAMLAGKPGSFEIQLDGGERLKARRVVVAVGATYFKYIPREIAALPSEFASHSCEHSDFARFAGRDVVVVGGGQSALETAALLYECGAAVRVLVRAPRVTWNLDPQSESCQKLAWRLTHPPSPLGAGWKSWFYSNAPGVFQHFPARFRSIVVERALGPAGAWWLRERVDGKIPVLCGHTIRKANAGRGKVSLSIDCGNGVDCELSADHVIAATGYRVDIRSLPFFDSQWLPHLQSYDAAPQLSSCFESSIPGLYFAGLAAARQFGPAMRFIAGAEYTATKIARACARAVLC